MPCDPPAQNFDDTELLLTLSEVENIITSSPGCEILWSGDINWDTSRDNHFTRTLNTFTQRVGLLSVWQKHNIDYKHIHTDVISTSTTDHFLLSPKREIVMCSL